MSYTLCGLFCSFLLNVESFLHEPHGWKDSRWPEFNCKRILCRNDNIDGESDKVNFCAFICHRTLGTLFSTCFVYVFRFLNSL